LELRDAYAEDYHRIKAEMERTRDKMRETKLAPSILNNFKETRRIEFQYQDCFDVDYHIMEKLRRFHSEVVW
jgi:hypothetical protein